MLMLMFFIWRAEVSSSELGNQQKVYIVELE
jgi:hypothetical protein